MKYICVKSSDGPEEIFTFPRSVDHNKMFEAINGLVVTDPNGGWRRRFLKRVSAGFVTEDMGCHGRSETMGIDSRLDIDTELLARLVKDEPDSTNTSMDYINNYYNMAVEVGDRVTYIGTDNNSSSMEPNGTVTGSESGHLLVQLDGESDSGRYHPTWRIIWHQTIKSDGICSQCSEPANRHCVTCNKYYCEKHTSDDASIGDITYNVTCMDCNTCFSGQI